MGKCMKTWLTLLLALWAIHANAWRCGTALIEVEDRQREVITRCGEPSARYTQQVRYELDIGPIQERRRYQRIDIWVYVTAGNRFARILYFEDGELKTIRRGDYGSEYRGDPKYCQREHINIQLNQTQPELELRCGPPDERQRLEEYTLPVAADEQQRLQREIVVDQWSYYAGNHRTRLYRFENGVLKWQGETDTDR